MVVPVVGTGLLVDRVAPLISPVDPGSPPTAADLAETPFLDHHHGVIASFVDEVTVDAEPTDAARAAAIFAAVRDQIWYDPFDISVDPTRYRASQIVGGSQRWCVPKAVLVSAAARAVGIPARLGFADVINHLQSARLAERMGTNVFRWHGYSVLWIDGRWLKASPAFNAELCARFGTEPLEFDGHHDALLHAFTGDGRAHMEYQHDRGVYTDLPFDQIMADLVRHYPETVEAALGPNASLAPPPPSPSA